MEMTFRVKVIEVGEILESEINPGEMISGVRAEVVDESQDPVILTFPASIEQARHLGARLFDTVNLTVSWSK